MRVLFLGLSLCLAFARPGWDAQTAPKIEHLSAVGRELSENIGLSATPSGALVAVAPFGPERGQLGLFQFAPVEAEASGVKAVGVTHHAKNPVRPAIAAGESGYYLAWHEEGERLMTSHFDVAGPHDSLKRRLLGVEVPVVSLLIDRDGRLAAFCFEAASLREAIARACEAPRKRRAI